ncbi:ABC transporter, partial [Phytophthora megakarya]
MSIGVELVAQPSVLFLDEPTRGLNARFAKLIMDGIRKVANSGRTIICTIYQPSYEVFSVFDNLLLLKRGGETVFSANLVKTVGLWLSTSKKCKECNHYLKNITLLLNSNASEGGGIDFVQRFNESVLKAQLCAILAEEGVRRPSPHVPALVFGRKRAAPSVIQMKLLTQRFFKMYRGFPSTQHHNSCRVLGLVGSGLSTTSYQGISSGLGIIFVAFQFQGLVSFNAAIPFAFNDRAAFYRERSAQTYSALSYFVIPYVFTNGLIIAALLFVFMGFTGLAKFILFWRAVSLSVLIDVYTGHLLAFALPNIVMAVLTGSVVSA